MRRSTVIANCLVNSRMVRRLDEAELSVRQVFDEEFPDKDFHQWNLHLDDATAANIIKAVGKASRINVKKFIEDLW